MAVFSPIYFAFLHRQTYIAISSSSICAVGDSLTIKNENTSDSVFAPPFLESTLHQLGGGVGEVFKIWGVTPWILFVQSFYFLETAAFFVGPNVPSCPHLNCTSSGGQDRFYGLWAALLSCGMGQVDPFPAIVTIRVS